MPDIATAPISSSPKDPAARAVELFEPALAAQVIAQMKGEQPRPEPSDPGTVEAHVESIATLFLADRFYDSLGTGTIEGAPIVIWNGMDSFIFRQDPNRPFRYRTAAGRLITPGVMETDGGSVPRVLRGLSRFSSWSYAPAFIVHDWIFVAKKCGLAPDNDFAFEEAALTMAEIMKTLMQVGYSDFDGATTKLPKAEDTLYVQYQAVLSIFARRIWDDVEMVRCFPQIS